MRKWMTMFAIHNPNPSEYRVWWKQFLCPKNEVNKYNEDNVDFKGSNRQDFAGDDGLSIGIITVDIDI
jgi:hypothetical protein